MLIVAKSLRELNFRKLMDVYAESVAENAEEFFPNAGPEKLLLAEQDFYQYLQESFFRTPGARYCIWQEDDRYKSALRLEPYQDGWLLEALETAPECRRQGAGEAVIKAALARCGTSKVYSHVNKGNIPSLRLHEKCGFRRILEYAVYIDGSVNSRCCTFLYEA